jgi:bifunctional UDP-N-acetylglucosamine pyrophosphorylase/glucosamine-1-phosphate N-acetyltransferase
VTETTDALHVLVLAAGKGTRMKSSRPKVLHPLAGIPVIHHVLRIASALTPASIVVVTGHEAGLVEAEIDGFPSVSCVRQVPQLGTGHAVLQAEPVLENRHGTLLLLSGDVPLLRHETAWSLVRHHAEAGAAATLLTAELAEPTGYGRVIRKDGRIVRIVEERDASPEERAVREINTGVYAFDLGLLFGALREIAAGNSQGEYYLPDIVSVYRRRGLGVETLTVADPDEVRGINTQAELAAIAARIRADRVSALMAAGVTVIDPAATYLGMDVEVGPDTVLHPNVHLEGRTRIGAGCEIHAGTRVVDSTVEDGAVLLNHCVITRAQVGPGAIVGPFARLRPEAVLGPGVHVGNFVELKKTVMGRGSKANHLAYLGDATIGEGVNIGAGTITCNYDGAHKHRTVIEDGVFIGSDSQLVAPVRIGRGAYVGAGSSITKDVPPDALAVARARQVTKDGWAARRRAERERPGGGD